MRKWILPAIILLIFDNTYAQQSDSLTVEKIMRDPKWIGASPDTVFWSPDSRRLYFSWNPDSAPADSLYYLEVNNTTPRKAPAKERAELKARSEGAYNLERTLLAYSYNGDVYMLDVKTGNIRRITQTAAHETNPQFSFSGKKIVYQQGLNLYAWDIAGGATEQLTNFLKGNKPEEKKSTAQEQWLQTQQQELMDVLKEKKAKKDAAKAFSKAYEQQELKPLYTGDGNLSDVEISPDGRFITYRLFKRNDGSSRNTVVPAFVTESGFTEDLSSRSKVGAPQGVSESYVYDRSRDKVLPVKTDQLPGITDLPDYVKDYTKKDTGAPEPRKVTVYRTSWSAKGAHVVMDVRSNDNKDRWIVLLDPATGQLKSLNRRRDEAWIAGPGIGWSSGGPKLGWIDENTCWYHSEASGYSHLYVTDVNNGQTKAITSGEYEVQEATLSRDKRYFYIVTNEAHPGQRQLYRMPVGGGKAVQLTRMEGGHEVFLSPDEQWVAFRYSYTNKPWELYLQTSKPGAAPQQLTRKAQSNEFRAYPWRDPEVVTFTARDGAAVHARLYQPAAGRKNGAAVIFVHGAGYLQNAHKWWSDYFREYMFHNLLADKGYTVLDIDYRGSAGYGRNWRTGIYRHMGGLDLTDQVDGAGYLSSRYGIDPKRIGIYGGSYGGFITLMGMFTTPGVFAAGAALRSVTDWAHYNHGYTSNILNEPYNDSLAYRRSSPIYYAAGLQGRLLMCHGMVDVNVHFQDIVRLSQRLIELGKDNWELAVYPVEDHGFTTPSSWTDEYKRVLKLFESTLRVN
jgi:dipeptidyl aminopeptidase/acylaminoacyl peptidase